MSQQAPHQPQPQYQQPELLVHVLTQEQQQLLQTPDGTTKAQHQTNSIADVIQRLLLPPFLMNDNDGSNDRKNADVTTTSTTTTTTTTTIVQPHLQQRPLPLLIGENWLHWYEYNHTDDRCNTSTGSMHPPPQQQQLSSLNASHSATSTITKSGVPALQPLLLPPLLLLLPTLVSLSEEITDMVHLPPSHDEINIYNNSRPNTSQNSNDTTGTGSSSSRNGRSDDLFRMVELSNEYSGTFDHRHHPTTTTTIMEPIQIATAAKQSLPVVSSKSRPQPQQCCCYLCFDIVDVGGSSSSNDDDSDTNKNKKSSNDDLIVTVKDMRDPTVVVNQPTNMNTTIFSHASTNNHHRQWTVHLHRRQRNSDNSSSLVAQPSSSLLRRRQSYRMLPGDALLFCQQQEHQLPLRQNRDNSDQLVVMMIVQYNNNKHQRRRLVVDDRLDVFPNINDATTTTAATTNTTNTTLVATAATPPTTEVVVFETQSPPTKMRIDTNEQQQLQQEIDPAENSIQMTKHPSRAPNKDPSIPSQQESPVVDVVVDHNTTTNCNDNDDNNNYSNNEIALSQLTSPDEDEDYDGGEVVVLDDDFDEEDYDSTQEQDLDEPTFEPTQEYTTTMMTTTTATNDDATNLLTQQPTGTTTSDALLNSNNNSCSKCESTVFFSPTQGSIDDDESTIDPRRGLKKSLINNNNNKSTARLSHPSEQIAAHNHRSDKSAPAITNDVNDITRMNNDTANALPIPKAATTTAISANTIKNAPGVAAVPILVIAANGAVHNPVCSSTAPSQSIYSPDLLATTPLQQQQEGKEHMQAEVDDVESELICTNTAPTTIDTPLKVVMTAVKQEQKLSDTNIQPTNDMHEAGVDIASPHVDSEAIVQQNASEVDIFETAVTTLKSQHHTMKYGGNTDLVQRALFAQSTSTKDNDAPTREQDMTDVECCIGIVPVGNRVNNENEEDLVATSDPTGNQMEAVGDPVYDNHSKDPIQKLRRHSGRLNSNSVPAKTTNTKEAVVEDTGIDQAAVNLESTIVLPVAATPRSTRRRRIPTPANTTVSLTTPASKRRRIDRSTTASSGTNNDGNNANNKSSETVISYPNIRILTTGFDLDQKQKAMVLSIPGATLIDDIREAHTVTHIIATDGTTDIRRTCKLMIAICRTGTVLTLNWLLESSRQGMAVDVTPYRIKWNAPYCQTLEQQYNFSMRTTLQNIEKRSSSGSSTLLFDGWYIYICPKVAGQKAPSMNEFQYIVEAAGGTFISTTKNLSSVIGNVRNNNDTTATNTGNNKVLNIVMITSDPPTKAQMTHVDKQQHQQLMSQPPVAVSVTSENHDDSEMNGSTTVIGSGGGDSVVVQHRTTTWFFDAIMTQNEIEL